MDKPEVTYYCNKCGYFGPTSAHVGCNYFACTSLTQQWADQLEAENSRIREELATAQATIERMREKSEAAKNACMVASSGCSHIKTHAECNEARQFAHATKINVETILSALNEALALTPNLDALHEARALECERLIDFARKRRFDGYGDLDEFDLTEAAADHRARKEEK